MRQTIYQVVIPLHPISSPPPLSFRQKLNCQSQDEITINKKKYVSRSLSLNSQSFILTDLGYKAILTKKIERKWSLDVCAGRLSSCGAATLSRSSVAEQDRNLDHITLQDHHHHDQNDGEDEEDNDDGADDDTLQIKAPHSSDP
ncbi:hypothetical protein MJO29_014855 [Puccinia striiformis f. sp. tritici]|nr:hypothetical protein MJO29_014855 [Puccinia striiformis f. sp. tritici]